jgi:hypothetical protein
VPKEYSEEEAYAYLQTCKLSIIMGILSKIPKEKRGIVADKLLLSDLGPPKPARPELN